MGCGKSSVGRKLSQLLCCPFIDLDEAVEEAAGKSIPEIFASEGEAAFRRLETEVLTNILSAEHERQCAPCEVGGVNEIPMTISAVLALGGGTVMTPECAEMVRENTYCIYLRASVDTLLERLSSETSTRPLLTIGSHSAYSTKNDVNSRSLHEAGLNTPLRGTEECGDLRHRIESLMSVRSTTYENTANIIIDTDGKSIDQICSEIVRP